MNIHAIETGRVKITRKWQIGEGAGLGRLINTLFDRTFTEWLPIYCYLIDHPEGLIVIDTGIPADANKRVWFPPFMPLFQRAARFEMSPELEIGPQLRQLGYDPQDVRWVILTHLHQDHDGGLHHFPNAEFLVSAAEWGAATGLKGRLGGYLNQRWPDNFRTTQIEFGNRPLGPFSQSYSLTQAKDLHLVPTPGHSAGHLSVIFETADLTYFFAGDATYSQALLIGKQLDGIGADPGEMLKSATNILAFGKQQPTVLLPSHDPEAAHRLDRKITLSAHTQPLPT